MFTSLLTLYNGWLLVIEFIFTLAMALKCYPLQHTGGLLAIEAVLIGMTSPAQISHEIVNNLEGYPAADLYGCRYLLYEAAAAVS